MRVFLVCSLFLSLSLFGQTVNEFKDIEYARYGNKAVHLDFYRLKNDKKLPVIILVHGGGWAKGSKESHTPMAKDLAEQGYAVANIHYRLSGEAKFPGAVEDTKASIRWVRANAEKYKLDTNKIFGIGGSAGGHLIAMAALTDEGKYEGKGGNNDYSSKIGPVIILGSGVDQYERVMATPNKRIGNCVTFLGEFKGNEELYKEASPHYHLSKGDPAVFMLDGEKDNPGKRYPAFIKKMNELGIKNHFDIIPGAKHGAWNKEPFRTNYVKAMVKWLKQF